MCIIKQEIYNPSEIHLHDIVKFIPNNLCKSTKKIKKLGGKIPLILLFFVKNAQKKIRPLDIFPKMTYNKCNTLRSRGYPLLRMEVIP